ncbi:MAG: hypothetical protein P4L84_27445 [Isosphaeraceae bacterium]|nr:hypothetical protein [Isosphaeraceae bacterium]
MRLPRREEVWVFAILFASYAFFWQSRDWNSASRLMLAYALVDRGTITLDGLDRQTGDIAFYRGHYYTDKLPGYSLLAAAPYAVTKATLGLSSHPLNRPGVAYWPADYWVTLATSGLSTALAGALLVSLARDLGCSRRRALLVGLAYGLGTPACVYATLGYGHQASGFALLASIALLWREPSGRDGPRMAFAGFLAAYAAIIELQVGPVSALLGLYLLAQVIGGRRRPSALGEFALGAAGPTLLLLGYNQVAFGSPWDMGYFHEVARIFRDVHSEANPLGLRRPSPDRGVALLWGSYRGLLYYAPILLLSLPGWVALGVRRFWGLATVSASIVLAVFAVNLSYPEWTGGWSTGPRLLLPLLPFAMLPVAGLLARGGRGPVAAAVVLGLAGACLIFLFLGVGGRIPHQYPGGELRDPLLQVVWPLWRGDPLPRWWVGRRFAQNLVALAVPGPMGALTPSRQWLQFMPLILAQTLAIGLAMRNCRETTSTSRGSDPPGKSR